MTILNGPGPDQYQDTSVAEVVGLSSRVTLLICECSLSDYIFRCFPTIEVDFKVFYELGYIRYLRKPRNTLVTYILEMQIFLQNPLPAPHRITGLQIITGNYRLTTAHHLQFPAFMWLSLFNDVYCYRRFTDKAGLFTAEYRR